MTLTPNITLALLIALGISAVGNIGLGWATVSQRDAKIEAQAKVKRIQSDLDDSIKAGEACTKSVEDLTKLADKRLLEATRAREAAKKAVRPLAQRADRNLATPAAVPGDDCKSAQIRVDGWLNERSAK